MEFHGKGAHAGVSGHSLRMITMLMLIGSSMGRCKCFGCRGTGMCVIFLPSTYPADKWDLDNAVSMLRQQLKPTDRVHGIILGSEQWAAVCPCQ
jgi:hypothetical protein